MMLNADQILQRCIGDNPMIEPFVREQQRMGALSYGPGYFGYDIRIAGESFSILPNNANVIRPADLDNNTGIDRIQYYRRPLYRTVLNPGSLVFASTLEYFRLPKDVAAMVLDKSTLARLGIAVQNTIAEPGWEGFLTVEITNHGPLYVQLTDGMPIAQMVFFTGEALDKVYNGRYQNQKAGTPALVFDAKR